MLTQKQLVQILGNPESYNIEITSSTTNMDKFCQAICAFSNDLPGDDKSGYLIIGAEDNGKLSGLRVDDGLLLKMTNIRTDGNILPQPVMTVERFVLEGGDLLVVEVKPSEFPPVRYRGRIWVRIGPRKSIASEAEEKILMERRISNIRTFDAMPCIGTTLADIDINLVRSEFLPKAVASEILADDKRPLEEQLASLGFFDLRYNCPTNGCIILFGGNPGRYFPGAYVQYVRFKGVDRAGEIINEHKFGNNLCHDLIKIDAFVETSVSQKELTENGNEKAEFDFSFVTAFRVIEKASKRYYDAGFGAERNPQETHKKPTRNPQETPQNIRERIIYEIQKNPAISGRELEALLGRTSNSIKHYLLQMNKEGIISHEGPTKGGRWVVLKK